MDEDGKGYNMLERREGGGRGESGRCGERWL